MVLILILILTIDEAVGEDAAEQEGDGWHVDGDVVDGHLHPSDDSVQTVHSRLSDVFKTLLKAPKTPTDCRLLTCISPHGVYLYLSVPLSLSPCCELYNYRNSAAPFIATNTGLCPGKSHQYLMNQNNWLVTGRVFEGSLDRKLPFIFRYFNAHSSQHF